MPCCVRIVVLEIINPSLPSPRSCPVRSFAGQQSALGSPLVSADGVEVYHVRERAVRSDVRDLFSWLAMGAVIENIVIAATSHGLRSEITYHSKPFPIHASNELIATIRFSRVCFVSMYQFIVSRVTNRKLYKKTPLCPQSSRSHLYSPS